MNNSQRLYTLLGDLSSDLLETAFPEAVPKSVSISYNASKKHVRRIGRAIAIYAASVIAVIAVAILIPLLTRITDPLGTVVPKDYYRPDLIWANDENTLNETASMGTEAPGALYVSFTWREDAPEDVRYAVDISILKEDQLRSADTNEYYILTSQDRAAFYDYLTSLGCERFEVGQCHSLVAGNTGYYFAATPAQIAAIDPAVLYQQMGLDLTEIPGISVELQYQLIQGYEIPVYWNVEAKKYLCTHYDHRETYSDIAPSPLKFQSLTPVVNQKQQDTLTLSLTHLDESCNDNRDCGQVHTYSPNYTMCLQVKINNQWYYVPIAPGEAADTEKDQRTLTAGMTDTIHVPLNDLYGTLPDGLYRFALDTIFPAGEYDWTETVAATFVISNGQKPQIIEDPESQRIKRDEVLIFAEWEIESIKKGTTYQEITAKLGAPILDVTGEGKVFRHPTENGLPLDLTYAYSDGALRLVSMEYAVEKVTDFPADYYRPDLIWANGVNIDGLVLKSEWYRVDHPGPYVDMEGMFGSTDQYLTTPNDPSRYAIYVTWEIEARFETDQVIPEDYDQKIYRYLTEQWRLETLEIDPRLPSAETPTGCYYIASREQLEQFDLGEMMKFVEHPNDYSLTISFHLGCQPINSDQGGKS